MPEYIDCATQQVPCYYYISSSIFFSRGSAPLIALRVGCVVGGISNIVRHIRGSAERVCPYKCGGYGGFQCVDSLANQGTGGPASDPAFSTQTVFTAILFSPGLPAFQWTTPGLSPTFHQKSVGLTSCNGTVIRVAVVCVEWIIRTVVQLAQPGACSQSKCAGTTTK